MGLCFSGLVFLAGTSREGLGEPTLSRAISRTTLAAENVFFFLRFFGIDGSRLDIRLCIFAHSLVKSAIIKTFQVEFRLRFRGQSESRESKAKSLTMDEREFFDERPDKKPANLNCPHCHQSAEYEIQWLVRTKKKSLPPRADERDRAKFSKAQSYMLRRDDMMVCKNMRCRKRFEITSVQSVAFLD